MPAFYLTRPSDRARFFADAPDNPTPTATTCPAFDVTGKPCYLTRLPRETRCHFCHRAIPAETWHRWLPTALGMQPFCLTCAPVEHPQVSFW